MQPQDLNAYEDLASQNIELQEGKMLTLYSEEIEVEGIVRYSSEENIWVAIVDWEAIEESVATLQFKIQNSEFKI